MSERYPFDTDLLEKGSRISREDIERAYSVRAGTDAYGIAQLHARAFVEQAFLQRGEHVTVVARSHDLHILTDSEATRHNERRFRLGVAGLVRTHARQLGVDRAHLTEEEVAAHDRRLETQGRTMQAIRSARRFTAAPRARTTPLPQAGAEGDPS